MCSPTLVTVGLSVVSAYMQYQQGKGQAAAIKAQAANSAAITRFNAEQNRIAATEATRQGAQDAGVVRENYKRVNATARAKLASSGLDADVGTPATLIDQNVQTGETNAMTAMRDAQLKAMGFTNAAKAQDASAQAELDAASYSAKLARQNGMFNAFSTLITGGSQDGLFSGGGGLFGSTKAGGTVKWKSP